MCNGLKVWGSGFTYKATLSSFHHLMKERPPRAPQMLIPLDDLMCVRLSLPYEQHPSRRNRLTRGIRVYCRKNPETNHLRQALGSSLHSLSRERSSFHALQLLSSHIAGLASSSLSYIKHFAPRRCRRSSACVVAHDSMEQPFVSISPDDIVSDM